MIRQVEAIAGYLKHSLKAQSRFRLHSPFVYRFYSEVIKNGHAYPQYRVVERVRKDLITFSRFIKRKDMGARAKDFPCDQRFVRVKDIARNSSVTSKKGQFLFRLTKEFHPATILELGTSLGISTMYIALAAPESRIITIEGCLDSANVARENFDKTGIKNVHIIPGTFEEKLPVAFQELPSLDLVFFDGNHKKEPTLKYFTECLQHSHPDSVFIFDDINWSKDMKSAWNEIRAHPRVKISIDLYHLGIVFFKEELSPEKFSLKM